MDVSVGFNEDSVDDVDVLFVVIETDHLQYLQAIGMFDPILVFELGQGVLSWCCNFGW